MILTDERIAYLNECIVDGALDLENCNRCSGTGLVDRTPRGGSRRPTQTTACHGCRGTGKVPVARPLALKSEPVGLSAHMLRVGDCVAGVGTEQPTRPWLDKGFVYWISEVSCVTVNCFRVKGIQPWFSRHTARMNHSPKATMVVVPATKAHLEQLIERRELWLTGRKDSPHYAEYASELKDLKARLEKHEGAPKDRGRHPARHTRRWISLGSRLADYLRPRSCRSTPTG